MSPVPAHEEPLDAAQVVHVPERSRYELRLGNEILGLAAYHLRDSRIVFTHTEVEPALQGKGLGRRLARAALDDARRQGLTVVPLCPFIADFVERHPDYQSLLAE